MVINDRFSLEQRRLTLARELAYRLIATDALSQKEQEKTAAFFAGALLMPRGHLLREVGRRRKMIGYNEIMDLKHLYGVTRVAFLNRLWRLDVISESTLVHASLSVTRRWREQEPEELAEPAKRGQRERARRFERLSYRALAERQISLEKTAELLPLPVRQVEVGLKGPRRESSMRKLPVALGAPRRDLFK